MTRSPRELRQDIRAGRLQGLTTGLAAGYVQTNLAILPSACAGDFVAFCRGNERACPLIAVGTPGDPSLPSLGADLDVRTDLPAYRVYRHGRHADTIGNISALWQDDHVAVAIGCWFSMEDALLRASVRLRHVELGIQGPLFRTNLPTAAVGAFGGPLVVSMRPFRRDQIAIVKEVTSRFPRVHGGPIHEGAPSALGIADLTRPDFGEPMEILPEEIPLFWGCGLTVLTALERSQIPLFITHAPGAMLITDLLNDDLIKNATN
jgi:uncharacterized protein YcsI (UPF0317 family)